MCAAEASSGQEVVEGYAVQPWRNLQLNDIEPRRSAAALDLPLSFSDQLGKGRAQRSRQRVTNVDCGLAQAPLDQPHIGSMDARLMCERLLRQTSSAAVTLHDFAERAGQGSPSHGGLET